MLVIITALFQHRAAWKIWFNTKGGVDTHLWLSLQHQCRSAHRLPPDSSGRGRESLSLSILGPAEGHATAGHPIPGGVTLGQVLPLSEYPFLFCNPERECSLL